MLQIRRQRRRHQRGQLWPAYYSTLQFTKIMPTYEYSQSVRYLFLDVFLIIFRADYHNRRTGYGLFDSCGTQLHTDCSRYGLVVDVLALHLTIGTA